MNNEPEKESLEGRIMGAIREGRVKMRPRWHFVLFSAFAFTAIALLILSLLYTVSLVVFFMQESGAWFVPAFGARGWVAFLYSVPWVLILLVVVFLVLLELLVRRYSFVYKKPLVASFAAAVIVIALGGFFVARTSLHHQIFLYMRGMPQGGDWYRGPVRMPRSIGIHHGTITVITPQGFLITDVDDTSTSSIVITPHTRLPYGADFSVGDYVVVFGDEASDSIQAFGVREIGE